VAHFGAVDHVEVALSLQTKMLSKVFALPNHLSRTRKVAHAQSEVVLTALVGEEWADASRTGWLQDPV
jgi:hypothetical protein